MSYELNGYKGRVSVCKNKRIIENVYTFYVRCRSAQWHTHYGI